ncbi:EamA family transporter RarD [Shouchella patagoniensis]|uniref:EamA family transporter RarD n=1 Tax=Shouchella patagoniensis TaxID=228576 RepID=UPI000995CB5F|nr:EamA family transporter RarD [Shouchella patagoniensis]
MQLEQSNTSGIAAAFSSYLIWGLLPLYWALLSSISTFDILMYRIAFAFVFILLIIALSREKTHYRHEMKWVFTNAQVFFKVALAAILISLNWFIFIFAVSGDKVLDASLGYYINPLLNVVLATFFLKEKLTKSEQIAVTSAVIGVSILIFLSGYIPWASFGMALSFCLYGFIKRSVPLSATGGLLIETLLVMPFALIYLSFISTYSFFHFDLITMMLLFGAGIVTAIPLILFSFGARRISFSLIGFLQYIAPTCMLILGIFVFHEPFTKAQFFAFFFIWIGLIIFTSSRLIGHRKQRRKISA